MDSKYRLKLCFCLLAVTACVKSIDLTTGDRLVAVECILTDVAPQTLRLSLTTGPTGIEEEALDGAVATLMDLTEQKKAGVFKKADDGLWHLDYAAIPEHKYRLEVEVPGYGATVWAEDTLPPAVNIVYERWPFDRLEETIEDKEFFKEYFYHDFEIPESWSEPRLPFLSLYGHHDVKSIFYQSSSLPEHSIIQGFVKDEKSGLFQLAESLCTDSPGVDNCNLNGSVYKSKRRWYPPIFSSASEVFSREEAIGLGIINPRVDGYNCHRRFLRIEREKALSQVYFTISGDFREGLLGFGFFPPEGDWQEEHNSPFNDQFDYLLFSALSDNYNAYLNSAFNYQNLEDLTSVYNRHLVYSNINDGVGIFGSFSSQIVPIDTMYSTWELYDFKY